MKQYIMLQIDCLMLNVMTIARLLPRERPLRPFWNILRSFSACVHARVFVHAHASGRNYMVLVCTHNKKFLTVKC